MPNMDSSNFRLKSKMVKRDGQNERSMGKDMVTSLPPFWRAWLAAPWREREVVSEEQRWEKTGAMAECWADASQSRGPYKRDESRVGKRPVARSTSTITSEQGSGSGQFLRRAMAISVGSKSTKTCTCTFGLLVAVCKRSCTPVWCCVGMGGCTWCASSGKSVGTSQY